ncbi:MAG: ribonuclease Z [Crocinitomicaceae bacterium]|nr:ribonuclease Z [Crocinitomicaceae bacterium]
MPFKLKIIGSGSAIPTLTRGVTSQYVNFNERHILIDCGEGTQMQLRRYKVKMQRLKIILISHLHGDHYLGLVGLLSSLSILGRTQLLTIYCPAELEELLQVQFRLAGMKFSYPIEFIHLKEGKPEVIFEDNILQITAFPVRHRIPTWGFRFDEREKELNIDPAAVKQFSMTHDEIKKAKKGEDIVRETSYLRNADITLPKQKLISYAYSSDTSYFEQMADYVQGVDLLYHEATFTEKQKDRADKTMHSTAREAATVAKKAKVGQLLLGHFSARFKNTDELLEEASQIFEQVVCVQDGDEFDL